MNHVHIFDKTIRTLEDNDVKYLVLDDVFSAAEISWRDFCMPKTPLQLFIDTELKPLYNDLGIKEDNGLCLMPIENTEVFILRASTGFRPLTPFSVLSECCRSVVDFWAALEESNGQEERNVFAMFNEDDQTFRKMIPE